MKWFQHCSLLILLLVISLGAEEIFEIEAVVGQSVELPCNMTSEKEGDKLNVLAWYKNGSRTAIYSRDLRDEETTTGRSNSARYRLVEAEEQARLQIVKVRVSDSGLYHCFADFAASPALKTHVNLVVIESPQRVWVVHENGSRVATASAGSNVSRDLGPYYVGDTLHLFCVVYGGKPQPSLTWWADQRLLKNSSTPLSEQRIRSDLIYGPLVREDHGLVFTCSANNNDRVTPITVDITVDMFLPPELVSIRNTEDDIDRGVARARVGEPLSLQCRVLGSRPAPSIIWRLNDGQLFNIDQKLTVERSQRLSVSEVQMTMGRDHEEARITCCAPANRRNVDYVCAEPLPVTVVYPPVLKVLVDGELNNNTLAVVKGSSVAINCSYEANPSIFELIWYHEDEMLTKDKDTPGSLIKPILQLNDVTDSDAGEYFCAASNAEGSTTSDPIVVDVTYPPYCKDPTPLTYGVGENEPVNLTCNTVANPEPTSYRWVLINDDINITTIKADQPCTTVESDDNVLIYRRPNDTKITTIFCWGINNVINDKGTIPTTPCTFHVSDETVPRPPTCCVAVKHSSKDITVNCEKGHDGGLPQKFMLTVTSLESETQLMSITNLEPQFIIQEPTEEQYKFLIVATNDKGDSNTVEINKEDIVDQSEGEEESASAVPNITTLSLSLCGGVALLALVACGLVLCARERGSGVDRNESREPALHAYNTEESNCETCNDSDEGSEYNVRRTESFRKAVSRYPSRNFDVRRSSSFHSARYMNEMADEYPKAPKYNTTCRVHSLQNINRKRDMDTLCDHLTVHLPPETSYNVPKPVTTFYTMPRKMRHKLAKELSDETSEITQNSDGFSLPPPPDEFGTYKSASRITPKDISHKSQASYATVRKNDSKKDARPNYNNVIISPMNTVGLPTISGGHNIYAYPDDEHQVNNNPFESD